MADRVDEPITSWTKYLERKEKRYLRQRIFSALIPSFKYDRYAEWGDRNDHYFPGDDRGGT